MRYHYPLPKKNFSAVLYESQELYWRQVGGVQTPKPPVASPLAAVAPDDAVEGLKMLQLTAFRDATFCAAVGSWSLSFFQHQWQPMKRTDSTNGLSK
jgi:hypothetical protein